MKTVCTLGIFLATLMCVEVTRAMSAGEAALKVRRLSILESNLRRLGWNAKLDVAQRAPMAGKDRQGDILKQDMRELFQDLPYRPKGSPSAAGGRSRYVNPEWDTLSEEDVPDADGLNGSVSDIPVSKRYRSLRTRCNVSRLTHASFLRFLTTGRLCGQRVSSVRFGLTGRK